MQPCEVFKPSPPYILEGAAPPRLGQAHHGYSGLRGTEGTSMIQADEAAVTEALRVMEAPSLRRLWGQPLSHQLSGNGGRWRRVPEMVTPRSYPHCTPQQHSEEQE